MVKDKKSPDSDDEGDVMKTPPQHPMKRSHELNPSAERPFFRRLRIRGDWSDTGPTARPVITESTATVSAPSTSASTGNEEVRDDTRSRRAANVSRFGNILTQMLEEQLTGPNSETGYCHRYLDTC